MDRDELEQVSIDQLAEAELPDRVLVAVARLEMTKNHLYVACALRTARRRIPWRRLAAGLLGTATTVGTAWGLLRHFLA